MNPFRTYTELVRVVAVVATGTFLCAPPAPDMSSPRESHAATLLANGAILITGGGEGTIGYSPTTVLASSDLYAWH